MLMSSLLPMGAILAAQGGSGAGSRDLESEAALVALKKSFTDLSGWVTTSAELVPADRYTYKPSPTVRSFGQLVAHSVDGYLFYCARAGGRNVAWTDATEQGPLDRATLLRKLQAATTACATAHGDGVRDVAALVENLGHASLHYGNMVTYLRMMGLVPPSS